MKHNSVKKIVISDEFGKIEDKHAKLFIKLIPDRIMIILDYSIFEINFILGRK